MFNIYGGMPPLPGTVDHEETEPEAGAYTPEYKSAGVWEAMAPCVSLGKAMLALKARFPGSYGYAVKTYPVAALITVRVRDDKGRVVWPQELKEK